MVCPNCYTHNSDDANFCQNCGKTFKQREFESSNEIRESGSNAWAWASLICAIVSVFFCPPLFGILGIAFGFKAAAQDKGVGIIFIFCNVIAMLIGMYLGYQSGIDSYLKLLRQQG